MSSRPRRPGRRTLESPKTLLLGRVEDAFLLAALKDRSPPAVLAASSLLDHQRPRDGRQDNLRVTTVMPNISNRHGQPSTWTGMAGPPCQPDGKPLASNGEVAHRAVWWTQPSTPARPRCSGVWLTSPPMRPCRDWNRDPGDRHRRASPSPRLLPADPPRLLSPRPSPTAGLGGGGLCRAGNPPSA